MGGQDRWGALLAGGGALIPAGRTGQTAALPDAPLATPAAERARPASTSRRFAVLLITAAFVILLDHLTKWWVSSALALDTQVPASGPVTIHYIQNSGAAFGLFPQFTSFYVVVAAVVAVVILIAVPRMGGGLFRQVVLGCVLGGALSDGFDRLVFGHVTDFIDFHVWPVFNVADMAIVGGMLVIVYELTFRQPRDVSPAVEL
jgi:signal peptidase II